MVLDLCEARPTHLLSALSGVWHWSLLFNLYTGMSMTQLYQDTSTKDSNWIDSFSGWESTVTSWSAVCNSGEIYIIQNYQFAWAEFAAGRHLEC